MEKDAVRVRLHLAALLLAGCLLMAGLQNAQAAAAVAAEVAEPETTAARVLKEKAPDGGYVPEEANKHTRGCNPLHRCRG